MAGRGKTLIVVPAYNEGKVISETLSGLRSIVDSDILVVDDGSVDGTGELAGKSGVRVVRHMVNLGLGAALETGFEAARRGGYDCVVTFDSDGQHNPGDIGRLLRGLESFDVVVGVREIAQERMPSLKRVGNLILNVLTGLVFGIFCRDSQSGLRAFNRKAIESIHLVARGYEVSSEILYEARRNGLAVGEVPVEAIYTEHSLSRGTGVFDGLRIFWRMMLHQRGD
jgi:UDP-N-acetylglucosamine---dolichyl-phosphate N-acetylglucosaminyltransferase